MESSLPKDYVVLIHGLGRSRRSLFGMQYWLRRAGYRVVNVGYPSMRVSVADAVRDWLQPALDALVLTPGIRVHFVTHSLGGIVFRKWAAERNAHFPLGRTVMLAPPNQGSEVMDHIGHHQWVRLILGPVVMELQTNANSMPRRLGPVPAQTAVIMGNRPKIHLFHHLLGRESDGIVSVASGRVEGQEDFLVLPADHTFIMWFPLVLRAVKSFLLSGSLRASIL
ncbi:MAG: alpha/beta fold hydrolase [Prosthecobacter sp.]|nr:alpha/beta fold hydrolase [Prosthecobacter sp.]